MSAPSVSPLPSSPIRPTKDDMKPRNKLASTTLLGSVPSKDTPQHNNTFLLEEITQPGVNATYNPSQHSSDTPSDSPSFVPSQSSSDEPSGIPSDMPSLTPSDAPSLTPTQVYNGKASREPNNSPTSQPSGKVKGSTAPVSVHAPTLIPTPIPSMINSESSSLSPVVVNSHTPTTKGSAAPSEEYAGKQSLVPSGIPSNAPITTDSTPAPRATEIPSASPSEGNSGNRTSRPSYGPSQTLALSPTGPATKNPTAAPLIFFEADIPGEDVTIHSTVQLLELVTSTDSELSEDDVNAFQSICKTEFLPTFLPKTQEADYDRIDCIVLSQSIDKQRTPQDGEESGAFLLSVLLQIRGEVKLPDNVAFSHVVSLTFQNFSDELQLMLVSLAYFPSVYASDKGPIVTEIQGGANPPSSDGGMTTTMLVCALLGGAILALVTSGLIIRRSRQSWRASSGVIRSRGGSRRDMLVSSNAASVPSVIGFVMESSPGKGRALGQSIESESTSNVEDVLKDINADCQSRTNSAEKTEGSGSLDSSLHGLDLLQSSVSSGESKLPDKKMIVRLKIGRRRKSEENSQRLKETQMLNALGSDDVSTDLECGAEAASNTHTQTKMEDCRKVSSNTDLVQCNETPEGESFLQMHLDNAAHTGEVLNDLGQFEEQWHDRLTRVRVSASAETPRQANTQYKRPPRSRSMIFSTMSNDVLSEFTDAESL